MLNIRQTFSNTPSAVRRQRAYPLLTMFDTVTRGIEASKGVPATSQEMLIDGMAALSLLTYSDQ